MPDGEESAKALLIAVGVIRDSERGILVSRRHQQAHQGGLWEFPGGKCEPGESIDVALQRELREELGIETRQTLPLIRIHHDYGDRQVILDVREVTAWTGEPAGLEGQPLQWIEAGQLQTLSFPAANIPIISAVQLPSQVLVTPQPDADEHAWCERIAGLAAEGITLIQFRLKDAGGERAGRLLERLEQICHRYQCRLVINSDTPLDHQQHGHGIHLTAAALMSDRAGLYGKQVCSASCHDAAEVREANRLGLEFVMLAPVAATRSHPGVEGIGWARFAELTELAQMPAYALGGMTVADISVARSHGGQGIAAISALWRSEQ